MASHTNIRMLAAVMFADIVGYSKMMQDDEQHAKLLRDRQREVIDSLLLKYHGQVMQYYGDGVLLMFGSALDAVNCGRMIQKKLKKSPGVPLRIGIHIGDVVYDDEGIYGDAVNIAARVQALGVPGSVMLSEKVVDEIRNQPSIQVESFGKHELKNIYIPVGIYALVDKELEVPSHYYIQRLTGSTKKSIAVLPFSNFSLDPENDYFSDGITEEIINALASLKDIQVASRTSVFTYKKEVKDIRKIGKELNVNTILEGSVRKVENRVRVTAQLIDSNTGFHIWSQNFDSDLTDIFSVQDEISRQIVDKLEASFSSQSQEKIYKPPTENIKSYLFYLKGLYHWNKKNPVDIYKAIHFFKRAIKECKSFANAYSYMANCYTYLGSIGRMKGDEAYRKAEKNALKAIDLNPKHAGSYIALGLVNLLFKWDFDAAEANFHKALTLDPESGDARQAFAVYYQIVGQHDKMLEQAEAAVKIDPISLPALTGLGRAYMILGEYEKALNVFNDALEVDPQLISAMEGKAFVFVIQQKYDRVLRMIRRFTEVMNSEYIGATQFAFVYASMGEKELAKEYIHKMELSQKKESVHNLSLEFALVYSALGDKDKAIEYLQKAVDTKLGFVLVLLSTSLFHNLEEDPRFQRILHQIGFPKEEVVTG